jgi:N-acetylglucosamine kinase-like BadF-type ATPase
VRIRHSGAAADVELPGVSRLEGDTISAVADAVATGWRRAGSLPTDRVVLGLTTAPTDGRSRARLCEAVASGTGASQVWLADDAVTGHAGALALGWGVSVITGTGVACMAVAPQGSPRIVGGHGYLVGDEGGGFWMGRAGLAAVLKAAEGRGPDTALAGPAERHFGGLADLGDRLHSSARPVDTVAQFAPTVVEAAAAGDGVAQSILEDAVLELVNLVRAAIAPFHPADRPVPVALGGRLLLVGPYRDRTECAITAELPGCAVRSAAGPPLDGAMRLGLALDPGRYRDDIYAWEAGR